MLRTKPPFLPAQVDRYGCRQVGRQIGRWIDRQAMLGDGIAGGCRGDRGCASPEKHQDPCGSKVLGLAWRGGGCEKYQVLYSMYIQSAW